MHIATEAATGRLTSPDASRQTTAELVAELTRHLLPWARRIVTEPTKES